MSILFINNLNFNLLFTNNPCCYFATIKYKLYDISLKSLTFVVTITSLMIEHRRHLLSSYNEWQDIHFTM